MSCLQFSVNVYLIDFFYFYIFLCDKKHRITGEISLFTYIFLLFSFFNDLVYVFSFMSVQFKCNQGYHIEHDILCPNK